MAGSHDAINLGQGIPDDEVDHPLVKVAAQRMLNGSNQYAPARGLPALRQAFARHAERNLGMRYDWEREVVVTTGASGGMGTAMLALVKPKDEVILLEPSFDTYMPVLNNVGARVRFVVLEPPDWKLNLRALEKAFSSRTKFLVLNTPMNPTGKVFTKEELEAIARLAVRYNVTVLSDEVYEDIVFDDLRHVTPAILPGMRDRTLRFGSSGKILALTGWKVGYAMGPEKLVNQTFYLHQYCSQSVPRHLQEAIAFGYERPEEFIAPRVAKFQERRDLLRDGLRKLGLRVSPCQGALYLTADFSEVAPGMDVDFCAAMTRHARVAMLPLSKMYRTDAPRSMVRIAFCKSEQALRTALGRLSEVL
jgi:aspartate/methionine/tyrosine aminotransferase